MIRDYIRKLRDKYLLKDMCVFENVLCSCNFLKYLDKYTSGLIYLDLTKSRINVTFYRQRTVWKYIDGAFLLTEM